MKSMSAGLCCIDFWTFRPLTFRLFISPALPRRIAGFPEVFEFMLVAQGVHGPPEAGVFVDAELLLFGEVFQRGAFPDGRVASDFVED